MITKKANGGKRRKAAHASPLLYKAMDVCRPALSFLAETLRSGRLGFLTGIAPKSKSNQDPGLQK